MPIYSLSEDLIFPHPKNSNKDGILAVGGDLCVERLLLAYSNGIFPWFNDDDPIIWWSPKERCVIYPEDIKISKSMKKFLKKETFKVTFDNAFEDVIEKCSCIRREAGTWITDDMINAYTEVHYSGFAHSVEVWHDDKLVGGLYGISIGKFFFGESMFTLMPNASKVALIKLSEKIKELGFLFIDCQMNSNHLESMGAVIISRNDYLNALGEGMKSETIRGRWG